METLSVNTAIIGILAVGARIADALWDLEATPGEETALLDLAVQEVKQCRSSIKLLHKTLCLVESRQLPYPERAAWIQADHVIVILTDMALALSDLQTTCEMHLQGSSAHDAGAAPSVREQCVQCIRGLCSRVRWHNLSIAMLMTVLKCKADSDARDSCTGLEHRMTRLLSSNAQLSGRMATLDAPPPNPYQEAAAAPVPPMSGGQPDNLMSASCPASPVGPHHRTWSIYSGYTLASLPQPTALTVPLTTFDLRHGTVFYTVAYARQASQDSSDSFEQSSEELEPQYRQRPLPKGAPSETIVVPRGGSLSERTMDWGFASKVRRLGRRRRDKQEA